MFDNLTIGERFKKLRTMKKDQYGKDFAISLLARELVNNKCIIGYEADTIRQEITKVEQKDKFPQLFLINGYCHYFNTTSDFLLGIRNTKPIDENVAMIAKTTGLSDNSIEMLKILVNYRKEYNSLMPGLGADIDAINAILEYQYNVTKKASQKGGMPNWSIFHYIKQYLSAGIYEREQQDRLRIRSDNKWLDINVGDSLTKNGTAYNICECEAINSESGSGTNTNNIYLVNTENRNERYVLETNSLFESYSKDNIFRELDKIKKYLQEGSDD